MRILNLTKHRRVCLQQMLTDLFHEFDSVKLKRNGFVIFRRNKFKFWKTEKIYATDLIITEIPQRIERFARRFSSRSYPYYDPKIQEKTLNIINSDINVDIIEYLWKEFTKIKFPINDIKPSNAIIFGEPSLLTAFNNYANTLIRLPQFNLGNFISHIKQRFKEPKQIINLNLKRILDTEYISLRRLIAA